MEEDKNDEFQDAFESLSQINQHRKINKKKPKLKLISTFKRSKAFLKHRKSISKM